MVKTVNVQILGRQEAINCEEEEVKDLMEAAEILGEEMTKTKEMSRQTMPFDRICLLSSLNLVNRMMRAERRVEALSGSLQGLVELGGELKGALAKPPDSKARTAKGRSDSADSAKE